MAMTTKIYGPGLPEGGRELFQSDMSSEKLKSLLSDAPHALPLVGGGVYVYHGGPGCTVSFLQAEEERTRVSVPRNLRA